MIQDNIVQVQWNNGLFTVLLSPFIFTEIIGPSSSSPQKSVNIHEDVMEQQSREGETDTMTFTD